LKFNLYYSDTFHSTLLRSHSSTVAHWYRLQTNPHQAEHCTFHLRVRCTLLKINHSVQTAPSLETDYHPLQKYCQCSSFPLHCVAWGSILGS